MTFMIRMLPGVILQRRCVSALLRRRPEPKPPLHQSHLRLPKVQAR